MRQKKPRHTGIPKLGKRIKGLKIAVRTACGDAEITNDPLHKHSARGALRKGGGTAEAWIGRAPSCDNKRCCERDVIPCRYLMNEEDREKWRSFCKLCAVFTTVIILHILHTMTLTHFPLFFSHAPARSHPCRLVSSRFSLTLPLSLPFFSCVCVVFMT